MLSIIVEWIQEHNGRLPDGNSTNKEEKHYYSVLRKIQKKYIKYIDGFEEFADIEEEREIIEEILEMGYEIDLWDIELPPIERKKGEKGELNPFTVTGILRDLVEFEEKIDGIKRETAIARFVRVCEALNKQKFKLDEFKFSRIIVLNGKKRQVGKTLEDVQKEYPDIDIDKVLEETGVELSYSLGNAKTIAGNAIRGIGSPITKEEKKRLIELGVIKTRVSSQELGQATFMVGEHTIETLDKATEALADAVRETNKKKGGQDQTDGTN